MHRLEALTEFWLYYQRNMKFELKKRWRAIAPHQLKNKSAGRFCLFPKSKSDRSDPRQAPVYLNVYDLTPMNGYVYWAGLGIFHSGVEGSLCSVYITCLMYVVFNPSHTSVCSWVCGGFESYVSSCFTECYIGLVLLKFQRNKVPNYYCYSSFMLLQFNVISRVSNSSLALCSSWCRICIWSTRLPYQWCF